MQITTVKLQENGYLLDGIMSVPNDPKNTAFIAIENWKLGKTHDWLELEKIFNEETAAHLNWTKIQSYEADIVQYNADIDAYNLWEWTIDDQIQPDLPEGVPKPKGYYIQEEVDQSAVDHVIWQAGYDAWVADTDPLKPSAYWVKETEIKLRPINLVEPTITPLATLVPNTPEPQFTLDEIKENRKEVLKTDCKADIESGFVSNALGMDYTYESTLKDQLNILGATTANTTVSFTVIDGIGNKLRVSHSASQMNQVYTDGVAIMQTKKDALYILLTQIDSAIDESAVNAIEWV